MVRLVPVPSYAFKPLNPELSGRTYIGKSPEDALINARADLARHYKGIAIPKITILQEADNGSNLERTEREGLS